MGRPPNRHGIRPGDVVEATLLEQWRQQHRVTLPELARAIGTVDSTVYAWLHGSALPTIPAAFRIAEVTDGEVPVSYWVSTLLGRDAYERMKEKADVRR